MPGQQPAPQRQGIPGVKNLVAVASGKGGVGKTTTTVNLGAALAEAGKRILLIDLDPQAHLTINYGLRFDHYSAYSHGEQLSPRVNAVWEFPTGTTLHGGYSRYFTPPPFELVGAGTFTQFAGTSAVPPDTVTKDTPPIAERANYYDLGVQQKLLDNTLTLGVDSFYEQAQHLIDEGQFGAPIILTPFNYRYGLIGANGSGKPKERAVTQTVSANGKPSAAALHPAAPIAPEEQDSSNATV